MELISPSPFRFLMLLPATVVRVSASTYWCNEAQSLHFRFDSHAFRPTLNVSLTASHSRTRYRLLARLYRARSFTLLCYARRTGAQLLHLLSVSEEWSSSLRWRKTQWKFVHYQTIRLRKYGRKHTNKERICFETTSDSEAIIMHLAYIRSARKLLWSEKHLYYLVIIAKLFIKYHDFWLSLYQQ